MIFLDLPEVKMQSEEQPLRQLPVDLSEIDFNASFNNSDSPDPPVGYLDTRTGAVHSVPLSVLRAAEEEEEENGGLGGLEEEIMKQAIVILEDTEGRYERIEPWESSEEYDLMESFALATTTPALQDQLLIAIRGRGAFRRFKDVLEGWPKAREAWFSYRDYSHRDEIRAWLNTLGIDPIDTSEFNPPRVPKYW
jgi:hypothetical protein